jgi:hypothetical protein
MTEADLARTGSETQSGAERRRFRRIKMDLPGRLFLPSDSREAACTILDMSPGGVAVASEIVPEMGSAVVLYLDSFGRFEGHVVRRDQGGFGLAFSCTPSKRERTAEQLILFLNNSASGESPLRRHGRAGRNGFAKFTRVDGQIVHCEVRDISVNGVSLKTDVKPPVGEFVLIAQVAGRVSSHNPDGIGIEFIGNEKSALRNPSSALSSTRA